MSEHDNDEVKPEVEKPATVMPKSVKKVVDPTFPQVEAVHPEPQPPIQVLQSEPPKLKILVARQDFRFAYHGAVLTFKQGDMISDPSHVAFCLSNGLPVRHMTDHAEFQFCPHCKQSFRTQS